MVASHETAILSLMMLVIINHPDSNCLMMLLLASINGLKPITDIQFWKKQTITFLINNKMIEKVEKSPLNIILKLLMKTFFLK